MMQKTFCILIMLLVHQVLTLSEANVKNKTCSSQIRKAALEKRKHVDERISEIKCKEYADKVKCTIPADVNIDNTYVEDARSFDFPHMALVLQKNTNGEYHENCDGTLISSRFILTAAHCSEMITRPGNPITLVARLGDHISDYSAFDGVNQVEVPVKNVYKHPNYTTPHEYHDIGLLELAEDVSFTEYIRPACLWNGQQFSEHEASVTSCTAYNRYNAEHAKELQKFYMRIITNDECKAKGQRGVGVAQVCSVHRSGVNDTHCLEYAGAPLQLKTTYNPCVSQVVGVASFLTLICGDQPSVFARVSSYLDWIEKIVWPRNV